MGKIVITGATGQLGGLVIHHLLEKGLLPGQMAVVARDPNKAADLAKLGIEVRKGDYDDPASLSAAFAEADKLLFVSASSMDNTLRVKQHANVVEAARNAEVKHIVYTSLAFADKMHIGLENVHLATEYMILTTRIPYTFLRNGFYSSILINPGLQGIIARGEIVTSVKSGLVNYVSIKDLALATATVLLGEGHENKKYELTSPNPISYDAFAALLSEVSGKTINHRVAGAGEVVQDMVQSGAPAEMAGFIVHLIYQAIADGQFSYPSQDLVQLIGSSYTTLKADIQQVLA